MAAKKRRIGNIILGLADLLQAVVGQVMDLTHLAALELQLAKKTLATMVILALVMALMGISAWFILLALVFFLLKTYLNYNDVITTAILLGFNVVVTVCIYLYYIYIKKYLYLPATRRQLARIPFINKLIK